MPGAHGPPQLPPGPCGLCGHLHPEPQPDDLRPRAHGACPLQGGRGCPPGGASGHRAHPRGWEGDGVRWGPEEGLWSLDRFSPFPCPSHWLLPTALPLTCSLHLLPSLPPPSEKVKVAQSRPTLCETLCDPHGLYSLGQNIGVGSLPLLQGSSQPRNRTQGSRIAGGFFTS